MSLEITARCSTIPTSRDLTGVGTLSRVSAHMSIEIAALCSTIPTPRDLTGVGTLSRVSAHSMEHLRKGERKEEEGGKEEGGERGGRIPARFQLVLISVSDFQ